MTGRGEENVILITDYCTACKTLKSRRRRSLGEALEGEVEASSFLCSLRKSKLLIRKCGFWGDSESDDDVTQEVHRRFCESLLW